MLAPGRPAFLLPESPGFSVALFRGRISTHAQRARRRADPGVAARLGRSQLAMGGALALRLAERLRLSSTPSGFIELGSFLNSGHYTNKIPEAEGCPTGFPYGFDGNGFSFTGLLRPRDEHIMPPVENVLNFPYDPIQTVLPYAIDIVAGGTDEPHCQKATLTPLGEYLIAGMMQRGMLLEVDHLPRFAYKRALEILQDNDYPALGTHGRDNNGELFELGGLSFRGFEGCFDPDDPSSPLRGYNQPLQQMVDAGMHRSLGFSWDFNGFARGPAGRFEKGRCGTPQEDPVTYPFTSYDGAVTFTEPVVGDRVYDFNTEGLAHIGLVPEYVENAVRGGATADDLEPLFRSAEGYVRMWEKAEARLAEGAGR